MQLVKLGYRVIIVGSSEEKGRSAVQEIGQAAPGGRLLFWKADLSLLSEVSRIAESFVSRFEHLDLLILCAFRIQPKRVITPEGFEKTFALYYLSRFALIQFLAGVIGTKGESRIIDFAVPGGNYGLIDFSDLALQRSYSAFRALGRGSICNDLMAYEYSKRAAGKRVTFILASPGSVASGIADPLPQPLKSIFRLYLRIFGTPPEKFAAVAVFFATDESLSGSRLRIFRKNREINLGWSSLDPDLARGLWEKSLQLIHERVG